MFCQRKRYHFAMCEAAQRVPISNSPALVPAAYLLMRVVSSALYNVVIVRWTTFSAVTLLLAADPIIALRTD